MKNEQAVVYREMPILTPLARADLIINIAKLKSHTLTVYSGAVKNLYGAIPGLLKAELHFRFQSREAFADMLVDIAETVAPQLSIMDGVWGMEGEGPGTGDPRKMGVLLASASPYALDDVAAGVARLYPGGDSCACGSGKKRGLLGQVQILGETAESCRVENFVRASDSDGDFAGTKLPGWLARPVSNWLALKPKILPDVCVGCGICAGVCPAHVIEMSGKAKIHKKRAFGAFAAWSFAPRRQLYPTALGCFGRRLRLRAERMIKCLTSF